MTEHDNQEKILRQLLSKAQDTVYGRSHGFAKITSFNDFQNRVPVCSYGDIEPYINQLKKEHKNILWPGTVSGFAVSAGTTGSGKHLPLTRQRLQSDRNFMRKVAFSYLHRHPNIFKLWGSHLSLPGSLELHENYYAGEISGFTAQNIPLWLKPFQLVPLSRLIQLPFKHKFDLVLEQALQADLRVITAVPSWILTLFQQALQKTGKCHIDEIWPRLRLLVCGGVKLGNYKKHLQKLMGGLHPHFIETYGASEGYFAYSDQSNCDDLKLVTDNGIFYEFIAHPLPDLKAASIQEAIPLAEVKAGIPYAMLVTTNAGLFRYVVGDIIEFTSVEPYRILVKGRLSEMLDDFGEGLYLYEAEAALYRSAEELEIEAGAFTIAPTPPSQAAPPAHHWLVQFTKGIHTDTLKRLARKIDKNLCAINRHYAIRRESNALGPPEISSISQQQINQWIQYSGKEAAQGKLPKVLREHLGVFGLQA